MSEQQRFGVPFGMSSDSRDTTGITLATVATDSALDNCPANRDISRMTQTLSSQRSGFALAVPYIGSEGLKDLRYGFKRPALQIEPPEAPLVESKEMREEQLIESKEYVEERTIEAERRIFSEKDLYSFVKKMLERQGESVNKKQLEKNIVDYMRTYNTKGKRALLGKQLFETDVGFKLYAIEKSQLQDTRARYRPVNLAAIPMAAELAALAMLYFVTKPKSNLPKEREKPPEASCSSMLKDTYREKIEAWLSYNPIYAAMFQQNRERGRYETSAQPPKKSSDKFIYPIEKKPKITTWIFPEAPKFKLSVPYPIQTRDKKDDRYETPSKPPFRISDKTIYPTVKEPTTTRENPMAWLPALVFYYKSKSQDNKTRVKDPVRLHQPNKNGSYIKAPDRLEAFPKAREVRSKNSVQGGGALRARWEDKKRIYEWDYQHGTVEMYDRRGKHLGEFDHVTGEQLKPAKPGRKTYK